MMAKRELTPMQRYIHILVFSTGPNDVVHNAETHTVTYTLRKRFAYENDYKRNLVNEAIDWFKSQPEYSVVFEKVDDDTDKLTITKL